MRSISPRSCSLGTTGRPTPPPHPIPQDPARLLRETTWSSKPVSSVARLECAELSSSMRAAQSFRAISSVSRAYGTGTAVSLLRISRDRDGALELRGRSWQEDGTLSARYWSEAAKERKDPPGVFYYWNGERPRDPNAPKLDGTGEIRIESADRAAGYFTTRSDTPPRVNARTSGVYLRADPQDMSILDGRDDRHRAELLAERLRHWKSITNA